MNRVSSIQIPLSSLSDLARAQRELIEASRQSASQTKADDVKGYGREAQSLVSAERLTARAESFVATGQELKTRMQIQDVALGRAADVITSLRQSLFQNVGLERGDGIRASLDEAFAVVKDSMNTSLGGRYLFGGALNSAAPVTSASLSDLAANPLTSAIEQNASLQYVRVEEERTLQTGVLANDVIATALGAIKRLGEVDVGVDGPFGGQLTANQKAAIEAELGNLDQAFDQILQAQSENGRLLKQVESSQGRQSKRVEALNNAIEGITGVDLAEVAVRLNQAKYSYEASASVFNTLRDLSLLNYLR